MLAWGRTLSSKQSASDDLKGFTSSSRPEAKKLEEIKSFAAKDIGLLNAIIAKVELI